MKPTDLRNVFNEYKIQTKNIHAEMLDALRYLSSFMKEFIKVAGMHFEICDITSIPEHYNIDKPTEPVIAKCKLTICSLHVPNNTEKELTLNLYILPDGKGGLYFSVQGRDLYCHLIRDDQMASLESLEILLDFFAEQITPLTEVIQNFLSGPSSPTEE